MTTLSWYGIVALVLIVLVFYSGQSIQADVTVSVAILGIFAGSTYASMNWHRHVEWIVMTTGLLLCIFGLLIARTMLTRSVSLRLLGRIDGDGGLSFNENLRERVTDMRILRLIQTADGTNTLTVFGALTSSGVAILYSVFRIDA